MPFNWLESWLKNKWVHHSLRLAFATVVTVLLIPFKLDVLEYTTYDWRMQMSPKPAPSGEVVLLSIEHETLRQLKRDPEALDWIRVLQKLKEAEPLAVVSLINPTQIQGSFDDLSALAEIAQRLPFQFGDNTLPKPSIPRLEPLPAPFEHIPDEPFPKTADRQVLARDGVTRRFILTYENQFTLHPRLAALVNHRHHREDYAGVFNLLDSGQMLIRYRAKGVYPTIKFGDAINNPIDPKLVRGKIVLIGRDTLELANDYITTPLSKDLLALSQLEMHANILDTLILNQAPRYGAQLGAYPPNFFNRAAHNLRRALGASGQGAFNISRRGHRLFIFGVDGLRYLYVGFAGGASVDGGFYLLLLRDSVPLDHREPAQLGILPPQYALDPSRRTQK